FFCASHFVCLTVVVLRFPRREKENPAPSCFGYRVFRLGENDSSTNALLPEIPGRRSRCLSGATECPSPPRRRRIPASTGAAREAVSFRSCASCGRASFLHALSCAKCARQRANSPRRRGRKQSEGEKSE